MSVLLVTGNKNITSRCPGGITTKYSINRTYSNEGTHYCNNCKKNFISDNWITLSMTCKACSTGANLYENWCNNCYDNELKYQKQWTFPSHNITQKCNTCNGTGTIKEGENCKHNKENEHGYCEHNGEWFLTQHD